MMDKISTDHDRSEALINLLLVDVVGLAASVFVDCFEALVLCLLGS